MTSSVILTFEWLSFYTCVRVLNLDFHIHMNTLFSHGHTCKQINIWKPRNLHCCFRKNIVVESQTMHTMKGTTNSLKYSPNNRFFEKLVMEILIYFQSFCQHTADTNLAGKHIFCSYFLSFVFEIFKTMATSEPCY